MAGTWAWSAFVCGCLSLAADAAAEWEAGMSWRSHDSDGVLASWPNTWAARARYVPKPGPAGQVVGEIAIWSSDFEKFRGDDHPWPAIYAIGPWRSSGAIVVGEALASYRLQGTGPVRPHFSLSAGVLLAAVPRVTQKVTNIMSREVTEVTATGTGRLGARVIVGPSLGGVVHVMDGFGIGADAGGFVSQDGELKWRQATVFLVFP
jgi:hypothetical protein